MSLMMPRLRALAPLPLVAALSLTAACDIALSGAREEATETVTRSFPLSSGGTLDIATTNGRIEVVAGTGSTVEVTATKVAKAATKEGAQELLKKLQIKEEVSADLVKLRAERDGGGNGPSLHSWGTSAEVRYSVTVPANTKLLLATTNGQIEVADVKNAAHLETVNGQIKARGLSGEVKASTVNGGVDIALASVTGDVNVETTNGGVTVRLPGDAKAVLLGRTTNGGLTVDGLQVEEVERSRRRLEARLNGGGRRIEAETTNGGITFTAAKVTSRLGS
jgi:putative adhesin